MTAVLLNGLVAVPFAFAVLTRLSGRREALARRCRGARRAGHVRLVGVGVADAPPPWTAATSTVPGSPSSACAGTSASTGSAGRWC